MIPFPSPITGSPLFSRPLASSVPSLLRPSGPPAILGPRTSVCLPVPGFKDRVVEARRRLRDNSHAIALAIHAENGKSVSSAVDEIRFTSSLLKASLRTRVPDGPDPLCLLPLAPQRCHATPNLPYHHHASHRLPLLAIFPSSNYPLWSSMAHLLQAGAVGAGAVVKAHERVPLGGAIAASLLWAQHDETTDTVASLLDRWAHHWSTGASTEAAKAADELAGLLLGRWTGDLAIVAPDQAAARELVADDAITGVAFTGSVHGGQAIARAAGAKPTVFELGGKDALIVCPLGDAVSETRLAEIGEYLVGACLTDGGQVCTSAERVIVAAQDYGAIVQAVQQAIEAIEPGYALTSAEGAARVRQQVDEALAAGAVLEFEDVRPVRGCYVEPARVLGNVPRDTSLWLDETFGPVIALSTYESLDDAVAQADDSNGYALGATVLSGQKGRAEAVSVARRLTSASMVGVDVDCCPDPTAAPFFGAGRSGVGAHSGPGGLFYFARRRVITVADDETGHGAIAR